MMTITETTTTAIQQRLRRFAPAAYGETVARVESRPRVSDGVDLAEIGGGDAGTDDELR